MSAINDEKVFPTNGRFKGWTLGEKSFLMDFFSKEIPLDAQIVELGTGPGYLPYNLLQRGYRNLHCLDLRKQIVFPEVESRVIFSAANLNYDRLPFADESVDIIVSVHTFEHLENVFHVVRECRRVLKKEGWLVWAGPYGWSIQSRIKFILTANVIGWRRENTHISFLTPDIFYKCYNPGFRTVRKEFLAGFLPLFGRRLPLPANRWFGRAVCHFMRKRYNA